MEHICGPIQIYNVCSVKNETAWDFIYNIIFLELVMTLHFSQFQRMLLYRRSRSSPFREWWAAFHPYMGKMFYQTHKQMINWRWDILNTFERQVNRSDPQKIILQKVGRTGERFSWYCSEYLWAKVERPTCWQYKPGDFLAVSLLNLDETIEVEDRDDNWGDPGASTDRRSHSIDANDIDNGEGEEDMPCSEKATRKEKGTKYGKGYGKGKGNGKGRQWRKGRGRETVKGKALSNKPQGEMISLLPLRCSCRRKCIRQTQTGSAN
jgi:hypothetical protein